MYDAKHIEHIMLNIVPFFLWEHYFLMVETYLNQLSESRLQKRKMCLKSISGVMHL